jgi:ribose 5-phosphate isomerase A
MSAESDRLAAGEAAATLVQDGMLLGYGTGRGAAAALEAVARRRLRVRGVPTSERTAALCRELGLPLTTLEETPALDLCLDGADEIDPRKQALKGGGGAMVREKLVALASRRRLLIIEEAKLVPRLGATRLLPIAVLPFGWASTLRRIEQVLPGAKRREELSDDGHVVIDAPIPLQADPHSLAGAIKGLPGVVDHGLFLDMSLEVVVGSSSGVRFL